MKRDTIAWLGGLSMLLGNVALACGPTPRSEEGLAELLEARARLLASEAEDPAQRAEQLAGLEAAIDREAGQKDAAFSGLFWYRDLERAKAAAKAKERPILSLRLLGELTCDESCANSRFFRTVLYANRGLAQFLRENFVLHWETVRPVPVITIDFGDGRVMRRTVAGNSVHYVLDAEGRVIDALPGLYGPGRFSWRLVEALNTVTAMREAPAQAEEIWRTHLSGARQGLERALAQRLVNVGDPRARLERRERGDPFDPANPSAADAAPLAVGKAMVEAPLVEAVTRVAPEPGDGVWARLAQDPDVQHEARLDDSSRALMRRKLEAARRDGEGFARVVREFEAVIARDMLQNELLLRPRILARLLETGQRDPQALNDWVYDRVFLTPERDPWLGLESGAYTALDGGGLTLPETP